MKKKTKSKWWLLLVIIGGLFLVIGMGFVVWTKGWDGNSDFKLAVISQNGLAMISVSPVRGMVNILEVGEEVPIWVHGGLGWYKSNKIMRLFGQEVSFTDYKRLFFYNFGFMADKVVFLDNFQEWSSSRNLISEMGIFGWIKYIFWQNRVIVAGEQISGDPDENRPVLEEVMMRDFGDDRVLMGEARLSVYNTSGEMGLAGFISERLEWAGFSVMEVDNSDELIEGCLMVYNPMLGRSFDFILLKNLWADCQLRTDDSLSENEIYLYFGDDFGRVIKYSNYVRSL